MEMACAECGCVVNAGIRVTVCGDARCCCAHLPVRDAAPPAGDTPPR